MEVFLNPNGRYMPTFIGGIKKPAVCCQTTGSVVSLTGVVKAVY